MRKRKIFFVLVIAICTSFFQYKNVLYSIDQKLQDTFYQEEGIANPNIKIIKIDEKTLNRYGAFGTWDRQIYHDVVDLLTTHGKPYFIGFDILFSGEILAGGDIAFSQVCKKHGNVSVVNNIIYKQQLIKKKGQNATINKLGVEAIDEPYQSLKETTSQGFSNAIIDNDGMIRKSMTSIDYQGDHIQSFSMLIAQAICESEGLKFQMPSVIENNIYGFTYTSKSHEYEEVSMVDVLEGKVDLESFKDAIVLVGAHAAGMQDDYSVPIEYNKKMYGVEIHANVAEALVNQNTVIPIHPLIVSVFAGLICVWYLVIIIRYSMIKSGSILVLLDILYIYGCSVLYRTGYEVPILMIPLVSVILYFGSLFLNYLREIKRRRDTVTMFKRYVSADVVEEVLNDKGADLQLLNSQRDVVVLFADICDFTSISEEMDANAVVDILNQYFNITTKIVFKHFGMVDKFIGDAIMAVFNSPFNLEDYEYKAILCALEMKKEISKLSKDIMAIYDCEINLSIGLNCGFAFVGNIGSEERLDYTVIGDTVNIAARLESKAGKNQILISKELAMRLGDRINKRELGLVDLKGKKERICVFELLDF